MRQDDHIARYAQDLAGPCAMHPDLALLQGVTSACGPLIYDPATEALQPKDLPGFRKSLIRKLSLTPSPAVDEAIQAAWETYETEGPRYRAVLLYILVQHFGKQAQFRPKAG